MLDRQHNPGMIPMLAAASGGAVTMSSREIADLCGKQHDNVMRDIRKMMQDIGQDALKFEGMYQDAYGREKPCFNLPKDLTVTLITGYRADLRYKVVKRLEQLEEEKQRGGFQVPQSFGEALRLAADQAEQIEAMKPVVAAMARLGASEGSVIPRVAAKALEMQERKFFQWLYSHNWAFKQGKTWQAYAEKIKQGYLEHETATYTVEETGQERTKVQLKITPKGMARLAQIFNAEGGAA